MIHKKVDILATYLESAFSKYRFLKIGEDESEEIRRAYSRGIFDRYFSINNPTPQPSEDVVEVCTKLLNGIFSESDVVDD
ncbi:MAG: hypothetical protein QW728_06595, partial [Thermoplasmata archaeon]